MLAHGTYCNHRDAGCCEQLYIFYNGDERRTHRERECKMAFLGISDCAMHQERCSLRLSDIVRDACVYARYIIAPLLSDCLTARKPALRVKNRGFLCLLQAATRCNGRMARQATATFRCISWPSMRYRPSTVTPSESVIQLLGFCESYASATESVLYHLGAVSVGVRSSRFE